MKKASVFRKKNVPAVISFMDDAGIFANNNDVYIKQIFRDKSFIKEVRDIADKTIETYHYCDDEDNNKCHTGFNITLGGVLDIIDPLSGCGSIDCKCNETMNIARTAGLFANKLFITDHLSAYLSSYSNGTIDPIDIQLMTSSLKILAPLINNQAIELRTPMSHHCKDCAKKVETKMMLFLESTLDYEEKIVLTYLEPEKRHHLVLIHSPKLERLLGIYGITIKISNAEYTRLFLKKNKNTISAKIKDEPFFHIIIDCLQDRLKSVIHGTESADKTSSLFMSKSGVDTLFLSSLDNVHIKNNEIEQWEAMRSINLPWVGQLDINQIIRLREEAYLSLESLRNHITVGFMQGGKQKVKDVVTELTAKIPELKQEILAKEFVKKSQNKSSLKIGSLAVSVVFYGLASANPIAAVGGVAALLASISHLHEGEKETKNRESKIITSPAYALLKAKDLLSCHEKK